MGRLEAYLPQLKTLPYPHQLVGTETLLEMPEFALFDEMGSCKTKQGIDAAGVLHAEGEIDTIVVACPADVRGVWADPADGELAKHCWADSQIVVLKQGVKLPPPSVKLTWVIVSYETLRHGLKHEKRRWVPGPHLRTLLTWLEGRKTYLICDEAHHLKSPQALQTVAVSLTRDKCCRVTHLTGSPIANNPLDLWAPMRILKPEILPYKNFFAFRHHHAVMGGFMNKKVIRWVDLPTLQEHIKPYCLRRMKEDLLDLPEKVYETRPVRLSSETWERYLALRDEALASLGADGQVVAPNAMTKIMRLSQVCSGFVGGVTQDDDVVGSMLEPVKLVHLSNEKQQALLDLLDQWPDRKVVVWAKFRHELEFALNFIRDHDPERPVWLLYGGVGETRKREAKAPFHPHAGVAGRDVLLVQLDAGGAGNQFQAASRNVYLSNDYKLINRQQSEDRTHRDGQKFPCTYIDLIATGPDGQRTVNHAELKALKSKQDLADLTTDYWRNEL